MQSDFAIISIRVLRECKERLRKVLKPETLYFLSNNYEDDGNGWVRPNVGCSSLDSDFFTLKKGRVAPRINISCIVGHNGDGKSSLVELFLRIINNFAYLAGFLSDHKNLVFIPGLYAEVFYRINDDICCISCLGEEVMLRVNREPQVTFKLGAGNKWYSKKNKRAVAEKYASHLFYTLVNNYSLYAYNSGEFKSETDTSEAEDSWIAALFHKNDAYQTPVVLSPQRVQGVININREYALSMQRLCELFFDCSNGKYKISDTEQAEGIVYKLETGSKLIDKTIVEFIRDEKRGAKNVLAFNRDKKKSRKEKCNALDFSLKVEVDFNLEFWESFSPDFYDSGLLPIAYNALDFEKQPNSDLPKTDFSEYLSKILRKAGNKKSYSAVAKANIERFLHSGGGHLTYMQFQRLYLVFELYVRWLKELGDGRFMGFVRGPQNAEEHAIWYLVYKTIRILEYYPDYFRGGVTGYQEAHTFFHNDTRLHLIDKWFDAIWRDVAEKTHITLKIRQTIYFLQHKDTSSLLIAGQKAGGYSDTLLAESGCTHYLDCAKYYDAIKNHQELAAALPPPIFKYDFVISRDRSSLYLLSRMSSGERQLLNSASAVVYHLKNIAKSKPQGLMIVYKNVNVILEEVELYFHPEYQRRFIKYLLDQIRNAWLPEAMAINLLFVTHSPFILSDIPRQQVLFLKDGRPNRSMQEDTFGANIHTLLQNGFFLNAVPIGEFAKEKISKMFETLNRSDVISQEELSILEKEIPLVSEPLLRSQLMRLFSQRKSYENGDYSRRIEELEAKIKYLEGQRDDYNRLEKPE